MSAAARPIAATFAGADNVGAAPASESAAATTAPITIERIQSLLGSPTKPTLSPRRDLINRRAKSYEPSRTRQVMQAKSHAPQRLFDGRNRARGRATHACGSLRRKRSLTTLALEHGPFRRDRSTLWKIVEWRMLSRRRTATAVVAACAPLRGSYHEEYRPRCRRHRLGTRRRAPRACRKRRRGRGPA